ncbi:ABC transporter family protein [Candidatus Phytoplasma oryzae]|uniref:ABC transporter family protein n=1 Tax=Candidatus Phytoplasma oryzae TaxID=203274 RepID=A0A139JQU8_9MOLU|nr:ABC transporter ATP-binding protein [Candidatus Phytoplasma oryzae]KXT29342.1 ABC transporter family protein [Candidatus Phytoplasma oryzae]RAM57896.1 hypothetical protein DH96_01105 [Candidatus Phytoplasma oryzae]
MFRLKKINKNYVTKISKNNVHALKDFSLNLPKKGLIFILGESGSGKTTLFNILAGIEDKYSGEVFVANNSITKLNLKSLDHYRNGMIGFIFQECYLINDLNVIENINLSFVLQGQKPNEQLVDKLLSEFGLDYSFKNRRISELSGGQKQRISIIRGLVKNCKIIFADEPTSNLDNLTSLKIFNKFKELSKEKLVIVISHDEQNAYKYADRIIKMKYGVMEVDISRIKDKKDVQLESKENEIAVGTVITPEILEKIKSNQFNQDYIQQKEIQNKNFVATKLSKLENISFVDDDFRISKSYLSFLFRWKIAFKSLWLKKKFLFFVLVTSCLALSLNIITLGFGVSKYAFYNNKNILYSFYLYFKSWIADEKKVGCVILFILFIFPVFMIFLYFNACIRLKKKEIGTLRLLGCNTFNVIKIFLLEAFIFAFILVTITSIFLFFMFNHFFDVNIFTFLDMSKISSSSISMLLKSKYPQNKDQYYRFLRFYTLFFHPYFVVSCMMRNITFFSYLAFFSILISFVAMLIPTFFTCRKRILNLLE